MKLQIVLMNPQNDCPELDKIIDQLKTTLPLDLETEKINLNSKLGQQLAKNNNLHTTPGIFLNGQLLVEGEITLGKLIKALQK